MDDQLSRTEILVLTTEIVASYVTNNTIAVDEVSSLIEQAFKALTFVDSEHHYSTKHKPAVPINQSVTNEYIICLEDGKKVQMLKRYIKTKYDMTLDQYKARWKLPSDYPTTAPNYTLRRSNIAKKVGLGTKGRFKGKKS